jgi:periplasmic divalent cation tolerance protein
MTLIYITTKNKPEAKKISKHLLNKKLIACANIHPVESMYWWKGKIEEDKEIVIIAKTTEQNFKKVETEIKKLHSYDIPCILRIPTESNKEYQDWVDKVLE